MYKVIVAHPSRQHSYRTAEALKQSGMLYKYVTRVYNTSNSMWLKLAKKISKGDQQKRIENRRSEMLDNSVLLVDETFGYIQMVLGKIDKKKRLYFRFFDWSVKHFEIQVAKYAIKEDVDAVIFYDTAAYWGIKYIKKHNSKIKCILDNSTAPANYRNRILLDNKVFCRQYWITLEHLDAPVEVDPSRRETQELLLADYHFVASQFSKAGLIYNGIDNEKIFLVPYGVDEKFLQETKKTIDDEVLTCLFVGHVNQRKGIAQILECARQCEGMNIRFVIVGNGREAYPELFPDRANVTYMGALSGEKLKQAYANADIFLFPVMGEGFGMVMLEALAGGLPVIASYYCGAPDIISDGKNGFLMENCSAECLLEKIMWFYKHKGELPIMSRQAVETAQEYSWNRYYNGIAKAVCDIFSKEMYECEKF